MSKYVGKYVCWGNDDGMFCWGRIKAEVEVNTIEGHKQAFILSERMTGPHKTGQRIVRYNRDTIIRKDVIDVEKDIFDRDVREFDDVTDEDLFLLVLNSKTFLDNVKHDGRSLGPVNMLLSSDKEHGKDNLAATLLKKRLNMEEEG